MQKTGNGRKCRVIRINLSYQIFLRRVCLSKIQLAVVVQKVRHMVYHGRFSDSG